MGRDRGREVEPHGRNLHGRLEEPSISADKEAEKAETERGV